MKNKRTNRNDQPATHVPESGEEQTAGKAKGKAQRADAAVLEGLEQINLHAAGIDVGAAQNFVCVPANAVKTGQPNVRSYGVFTQEQDDLVEWLKESAIATVAMEATGIYWMSLYDKLESAGMKVVLVDPHSVRHVPGRKSDVLDCQWLQQLHTYRRHKSQARALHVFCAFSDSLRPNPFKLSPVSFPCFEPGRHGEVVQVELAGQLGRVQGGHGFWPTPHILHTKQNLP
jgi:hypothetical protein